MNIYLTGGMIFLFGMYSHAMLEVGQNLVTGKELTVFGSYVGYNVFPRAVQVLKSGAELTTHDVSDLPKGIDATQRGEVMKVMVTP